jgi:hypothetical protein
MPPKFHDATKSDLRSRTTVCPRVIPHFPEAIKFWDDDESEE